MSRWGPPAWKYATEGGRRVKRPAYDSMALQRCNVFSGGWHAARTGHGGNDPPVRQRPDGLARRACPGGARPRGRHGRLFATRALATGAVDLGSARLGGADHRPRLPDCRVQCLRKSAPSHGRDPTAPRLGPAADDRARGRARGRSDRGDVRYPRGRTRTQLGAPLRRQRLASGLRRDRRLAVRVSGAPVLGGDQRAHRPVQPQPHGLSRAASGCARIQRGDVRAAPCGGSADRREPRPEPPLLAAHGPAPGDRTPRAEHRVRPREGCPVPR